MKERCFACGKPLGNNPHLVDTRDAQSVYVGIECYKRIAAAGENGYQPERGGPRLYLLPEKMMESGYYELSRDVQNPKPDKRSKRLDNAVVWPKGMRMRLIHNTFFLPGNNSVTKGQPGFEELAAAAELAPFAIGQLTEYSLDQLMALAVETGIITVDQVVQLHKLAASNDNENSKALGEVFRKHWLEWNRR